MNNKNHSEPEADVPEADATETSVDKDALRLGAEVRKLRKARKKSLAEVAQAIGRSVSFISQLERGLTQPSIANLKGIAETLGVPFGWFFLSDKVPPEERGRVVRSSERQRVGVRGDGVIEELLSPDISGAFETFLTTIEAGAAMSKPSHRQTEEEGYIVKGQLDLWIGEQLLHLHEGDSFRIVREPFHWVNPSAGDTVVVWVISPPTY